MSGPDQSNTIDLQGGAAAHRPDFAVRNIILTGFMGAGKTAVGHRLAEWLGWSFVDTDDVIEERAGKSISRIFAEEGEPAFRRIESEVARDLTDLREHVVATGGGMVVDPANLGALEQAGALVLLEAAPRTIWERVREHTHRPLLQKSDPLGEIERLLEARREAYGRVTIKVVTDGKSPESICREIIEKIQAHPVTHVNVDLGERSYPIRIGYGWIDELGERLAPFFPPRPCVVVTHPRIAKLWSEPVLASLSRAGYRPELFEIPEGEDHKTVATAISIVDHMIGHHHTRGSAVVALGGGVVGDIAGFAAAITLRGIACVQLPTTLLAMVDSSVGGKTGVNHAIGKNLIGAFWQPVFVGAELKFLETLPDEELRSGLAEVIKYGVIADTDLFAYLEQHIEAALGRDPRVLTHLVAQSCRIKAGVVARDEREGGVRAILNYGHTFGHAAEALTGFALRHGEAVAMGMVAAARLAQARGLTGPELPERIEALLQRASLPTRLPRFAVENYWAAMRSDKKAGVDAIRFVLPEQLGRVSVYDDLSPAQVASCLELSMGERS